MASASVLIWATIAATFELPVAGCASAGDVPVGWVLASRILCKLPVGAAVGLDIGLQIVGRGLIGLGPGGRRRLRLIG